MEHKSKESNENKIARKITRKVEIKSTTKVGRSISKKSLKSGNLKTSGTFPVLNKSEKNLKKPTIPNPLKSATLIGNAKSDTQKLSSLKVPQNAAVHFGNFYGLQENPIEKSNNLGNDAKNIDLRTSTKSEFTRQMVHKLERSAGTEEYARQVSAFLEETVEPADFRVNPLPSENSIPDGRQNPTGYPLWYKDPYKMPMTAKKEYQLLKEKYGNMNINSNVRSTNFLKELSTSEDEEDNISLEEIEEHKKSTDKFLTNQSSNHSSSTDDSSIESSVSYDENDDEEHSTILPGEEEEDEEEDYETVDTALSVR
ncbi:AP-3 complex subunit beta-1-like [Vespula maculifrons]|uniref:AP-3 complex subunit beta-1-like n=1 Tax=Vespula maculifrons TaxID=7453 RepID=A0ABD2CJD8_VESMC